MQSYYKQLEEKYSKFVGSDYAVSCNSGTSALHLALLALGIGKDDEVIMPDFTMAACGFSVLYTGAKPVLIDCDDTLNIDTSLIETRITDKTKAIMAVHIYGRLCNMPEIMRIADKHNLKVIEDACEAQGAVFKSKADITCYSFYENKIIHAEEGGICTTDNKTYADRMNYYKNMCFDAGHTYMHYDIGYNYRMPESQAKLALESLKIVKGELAFRRKVEENLDEKTPLKYRMPKRDVVWVYDTLEPIRPTEHTRRFFKPLSSMPMFGGECTSPKAKHYSEKGSYYKI